MSPPQQLQKPAGRNCALSIVLFIAGAPFAGAQIPDQFHNLQVLPKDIQKAELVGLMKGFTMALGVRCEHCHVGEAGAPLSTFDFPADTKAAKRNARAMLRLTREINQRLDALLGAESGTGIEVRCVTCHHGLPRPQTLPEVLVQAVAEQGAEGALTKYRELRAEYYGSDSFDFSEGSLVMLAEELASKDRLGEAERFLQLNLEFYPQSVWTHFTIAELALKQGEKEKARSTYRKILEITPEDAFIKQRLEELDQADPPPATSSFGGQQDCSQAMATRDGPWPRWSARRAGCIHEELNCRGSLGETGCWSIPEKHREWARAAAHS